MSGSEDPLTPQQEKVRRLLAAARHTDPTPPEVVARLDAVLEDLGGESERTAPVDDLARRRRRAASLLVAAAAVVAIGIGANQLITPQPQAETSSAGDAGLDSGSAESEAQPESQPKAQSGEAPAESSEDAPLDGASLFAVRRNHLADDLTDARRVRRSFGLSSKASSADRAAGILCSADAWGQGRFVPVRYGNQPAVVVFRRPVNETQVADLFLCGSRQPVRSVTLAAP
ncbi:MAG TPA: hypothetical protein VFY58_03720 [Nocardioides sp.]|nr:hypothetical protein [Nocardioides sp.]